ncbi:hypothetical protein GCM10027052_25480 [Parafrigoribacterium mesophilum]
MKENIMVTTAQPVQTATERRHGHRRLESVAGSWPIGVKVAASAVLIGAFVAQLVNRSLLDMSHGYASLFHQLATDPGPANTAAIAGIFAPALLVGSVLIWFRLARTRSRIASWITLISGVLAFTCLPLMMGFSVSAFALADAHLGTTAAAAALSGYAGPPAAVLFTVYNNASMLTILAAAWALWRSHAVSRASVILLVLFIAGDIAGLLPFDAHYLGLAAAVLMSVSLFTATAPFRDGDPATSIKP